MVLYTLCSYAAYRACKYGMNQGYKCRTWLNKLSPLDTCTKPIPNNYYYVTGYCLRDSHHAKINKVEVKDIIINKNQMPGNYEYLLQNSYHFWPNTNNNNTNNNNSISENSVWYGTVIGAKSSEDDLKLISHDYSASFENESKQSLLHNVNGKISMLEFGYGAFGVLTYIFFIFECLPFVLGLFMLVCIGFICVVDLLSSE